ncbi:MAG TPA: hypothetical protein VMG81_03405 [Thermoplasmata archaeon]|nr:hypothetical protein [Thermoplasmata archaeon]
METVAYVRDGQFKTQSAQSMGNTIRRLLTLVATHNVSFGSPDATWAVVHEMVRQTLLDLAESIRIYNIRGPRPGVSVISAPKEEYPLDPADVLSGGEDPRFADIGLTDVNKAAARMIGVYAPDFVDVIPPQYRREALPPFARGPTAVQPHIEVNVPTEELREEIRGLGEELRASVQEGLSAGFERLVATMPNFIPAPPPAYTPPPAPVYVPPPVEAPAPAPAQMSIPEAPPAPTPAAIDTELRRRWQSLLPTNRIVALAAVGITGPSAARVATFGWAALPENYRRALTIGMDRWAPPAPVAPGGAASMRRQRTFGGEGGAEERVMGHVSLEVKYEPHTLGQVTGNEDVVELLQAAIRTDRIPSFLIFVSTRGGLGKTSIARALARDYLGKKQQELDRIAPGEYADTVTSARGNPTFYNYLEIQGQVLASPAGFTRIENFLRTVPTAVGHVPGFQMKKVLILDDVDKLAGPTITGLKTLLQPQGANSEIPNYIVGNNLLIITTNARDAFEGTPLSTRARYFIIQPTPEAELRGLLQGVMNAERISCPEVELDRIVSRANGSPRDSLKNLDDAVTLGRCSILG